MHFLAVLPPGEHWGWVAGSLTGQGEAVSLSHLVDARYSLQLHASLGLTLKHVVLSRGVVTWCCHGNVTWCQSNTHVIVSHEFQGFAAAGWISYINPAAKNQDKYHCVYLSEDGIGDDGSSDSGAHALGPDADIGSLLAVHLLQLARVKVRVTIESWESRNV